MSERTRGTGLFVLILLVTAGIAAALFWYVPERRRKLRAQDEWAVFQALKSLASIEADFRGNDRDTNGVKDFWTGDLAGLVRTGFMKQGLAEADAAPLTPVCPQPVPYHGYYFIALQSDNSVMPAIRYRQDTDQKSGKVHHLERFGFLAYPAEPGITGNYLFMINENNTVIRASAGLPLPANWPSDTEFGQHWCKPR